ncbi:MAG: tetratricopeptide repeat protein [Lapillicoccus sp.]
MTSSPDLPGGSRSPGGDPGSDRAGVERAARRAESLNSLGRYDQALTTAARGLAGDPEDCELLVQAAIAHLGLGAPAQARLLLHSAAAVDPGSARVHRILSFVALQEGLVPEAVQAGLRAAQLSPFDSLTHAQLARAWARQGDRAAALTAAGRAVELAPDSADSHIAMADVLFPDGTRPAKADLARAEEHLGRALQLEPGSAAALNDLARVHLARGHGVLAAGRLASAVRADPMTEVMQRNMDVVFISLVARAHWILFVMWFVTRQVFRAGGGDSPRLVPLVLAVAGLGLVAWVLLRLHGQIPQHLGAFVRGFVRRERVGSLWTACLAATAVLFVASAVAPDSIRESLLLWAWVPLLAGAVLSWVRVVRQRRQR